MLTKGPLESLRQRYVYPPPTDQSIWRTVCLYARRLRLIYILKSFLFGLSLLLISCVLLTHFVSFVYVRYMNYYILIFRLQATKIGNEKKMPLLVIAIYETQVTMLMVHIVRALIIHLSVEFRPKQISQGPTEPNDNWISGWLLKVVMNSHVICLSLKWMFSISYIIEGFCGMTTWRDGSANLFEM